MAKEHILVVDDEEDILELVEYNLIKHGFSCTCVGSGGAAVKTAKNIIPDLILLDLMLPGLDGLEVCSLLRADSRTRQIPIIMLTAKGAETDVVRGLEMGADDYIPKPFSPKVLMARIAAVLRRKGREGEVEQAPVHIHNLHIHPGRHEVLIGDRPAVLTSTEFKILHFLARRPGWVFTRGQIVDAVHGTGYPVTDRAVDVQIVGLRKKLGGDGDCIETVRGVGYRVRED